MINLTTVPTDFTNFSVAVLGAQRSGVYGALLLAQKGARVLLSDINKVSIEGYLCSELERLGVQIEMGGHSPKVLASDFIVLSPGIPNSAPIVQALEAQHTTIVSEIELASWFTLESEIIAVTGSNGKSTTTSLIYELFKNTIYHPYCGGNIGIPFSKLVLDAVSDNSKQKIFILELSSFQLERIFHFHPAVAILLNISPDHMDRYHHDLMEYLRAKLHIVKNQAEMDYLIYNSDDSLLRTNLPMYTQQIPFGLYSNYSEPMQIRKSAIYYQNQKVINLSELGLIGEHNLYNILAAVNTALLYDIPLEHIVRVLREFKGIEHRLEYVASINDVDYYNDSKATNVDSVNYALKSFTKPVIIILGGRDKDSDFSLLIPNLKKHAKAAILIGEAASKIKNTLLDTLPLLQAGSLEDATRLASSLSSPGDVILLSPACASFDMFKNFEHRGQVFKQTVQSLKNGKET
jgi:UDP-N-acetylmuramoylalanine--D-glutamate ligase